MWQRLTIWWQAPIARGWALVAFLGLAIGIGLAIQGNQQNGADSRDAIVTSGRAISVSGCNRDYNSTFAIRGVLLASKAQTARALKNGDITSARAVRANTFYDDQLKKLKLPDCRLARKVVTGDPNHTTIIPKPLYPLKE